MKCKKCGKVTHSSRAGGECDDCYKRFVELKSFKAVIGAHQWDMTITLESDETYLRIHDHTNDGIPSTAFIDGLIMLSEANIADVLVDAIKELKNRMKGVHELREAFRAQRTEAQREEP